MSPVTQTRAAHVKSAEFAMDASRCARSLRLGLVGWLAFALAVAVTGVEAQDEEIIDDPELAGSGAGSRSGGDEDEVIADPESDGDDHGWGEAANIEKGVSSEEESSAEEYDPQANTGLARIEVDGRFAPDIHHEGLLEDAYESRLRLDVDVDFRRSRKLRLGVGVRTDLFWGVPSGNDPSLVYRYEDFTTPDDDGDPTRVERTYSALEQDRFELDIIPLAAFVDGTLGDGFHVRFGIQPVSVARADFFSPMDMLAVYDFRGQPKLDPGQPRISQPALRVDWDLSSWATLQVIYVPWFMPHLTRANRDGNVGDRLGFASMPTRRDENQRLNPGFDRTIDPSFQTGAGDSLARFVGPAPDFTTGQVQGRLNMRGSSYEFAIHGGTALEKTGSLYATPSLEEFLRTGEADALIELLSSEVGEALPQVQLFDVEYHRYYQLGLDGSIDIAPITLAFEVTYSPARYFLYAARDDRSRIAQPNTTAEIEDPEFSDEGVLDPGNIADRSLRKGVPTVQGVLHLDWIHGETFAFAAEGFWVQALEQPYDRERHWWGFKRDSALFLGGIFAASYRIDDGRWTLQTSLATLLGPSFISVSQVEWRAVEGLYLNVGAMFYEGPDKLPGAQDINVGGLLSSTDQVYVGFRYVP